MNFISKMKISIDGNILTNFIIDFKVINEILYKIRKKKCTYIVITAQVFQIIIIRKLLK